MSDSKVTQLSVLATLNGEDLVLVIDDPNGTPVSKHITIQSFLSQLPANTAITGDLSATGNTALTGAFLVANTTIQVSGISSIASNNATTQFGANPTGILAWDTDYLYIATSDTVIRRVALTDWDS